MMRSATAWLILALSPALASAQTGIDAWDPVDTLDPLPYAADFGGALTGLGNGEDFYLYPTNTHDTMYHYSVAAGEWEAVDGVPLAYLNTGHSLVHDGGDYLYTVRGFSGYDALWRYSLSDPGWTEVGNIIFYVNAYGAPPTGGYSQLLHTGRDLMVVTASSPTIHRYILPTPDYPLGLWVDAGSLPEEADGTPNLFAPGCTAVCPGNGDDIYVLQGGLGVRKFWHYSIADRTFSRLADFPSAAFRGSSLCWPGGSMIYALAGGSTGLHAYSMTGKSWSTKAPAPGTIARGAALVHSGEGDALYATQGGNTTSFWRYGLDNEPPEMAAPLQRRRDKTTPIPAGATIQEPSFTARVQATDPEGHDIAYDVEVKPAGTPFDEVGIVRSVEFPSGTAVDFVVGGLQPATAWHWRARALDRRGRAGEWSAFGSNPEVDSEIDFATRSNAAPGLPSAAQIEPESNRSIGVNGGILGRRVIFRAPALDPDAGEELVLEIELCRVGDAFSGQPTHAGEAVALGEAAEAATGELEMGSYLWRSRLVDLFGAAGPWEDFGSNGGQADFSLVPYGSSGGPACGQSAGAGGAALVGLLAAFLWIGRGR